MGSVPQCSEAILYWGTDPFIPINTLFNVTLIAWKIEKAP